MYQEETTFNLRFQLEAQFPESYEGEKDDMVWAEEWETRIKPEVIKAIFHTLRNYPDWPAHIRNRGRSADDEIEIALVKEFTGSTG